MKDKFINFLKEYNIYDEKVLEYYFDNITYVDYNEESEKHFIGCYPIVKNNSLNRIKVCAPKMEDNVSVSINIHEYVHMLSLYNNLNQSYKYNNYEEVLPVFYELIFMKDNMEELKDYYKYYENYIMNNSDKEYIVAMKLFNELISDYDRESINSLEVKVRSLVNKK